MTNLISNLKAYIPTVPTKAQVLMYGELLKDEWEIKTGKKSAYRLCGTPEDEFGFILKENKKLQAFHIVHPWAMGCARIVGGSLGWATGALAVKAAKALFKK